MTGRGERVARYFGEPERYLSKGVHVDLRARLVRELLGEPRDARILDLGCGDGGLSLPFAGAGNELVLVDRSPEMLERARRRAPPSARVTFVHGDLDTLELDGRFDVVLCVGVLAHVDNPARTIARVAGLLAPGGRAVFQITDADRALGRLVHALYALRRGGGYALHRLSRRELDRLAGAHGLRRLACRRHLPLLPGMGLLPARWLRRYEHAGAERPLLTRLGSETLLLYAKPP